MQSKQACHTCIRAKRAIAVQHDMSFGGGGIAEHIRAQRCRVYVHQPRVKASDFFTESSRRHDEYSSHFWIQRALLSHPWRVMNESEADVVYFNASLTHRHPERYPLAKQLSVVGERMPRCATPVLFATSFFVMLRLQRKYVPERAHMISEMMHSAVSRANDLLAPKVVSQPNWLVGREPALARVPWAQRRLVFMAGHIPAPYLSTLRWHLWRQLHADPRATVRHHDLTKLVKYASCSQPDSAFLSQPRLLLQECARFCAAHPHAKQEPCIPQSGRAVCAPPEHWHLGDGVMRSAADVAKFRRLCRHNFDPHNFTATWAAAGEHVVGERLAPAAYMEQVMSHRFCIAAKGDYPATRKFIEYMAAAAVGGCLPLIIASRTWSRVMPYADLVNYCDVAFVIQAGEASRNMSGVLERLATVTEEEAQRRQRNALALLDALVYRNDSSVEEPSAAEVAIAQMCTRARRVGAASQAERICANEAAVKRDTRAPTSVTPTRCVPL